MHIIYIYICPSYCIPSSALRRCCLASERVLSSPRSCQHDLVAKQVLRMYKVSFKIGNKYYLKTPWKGSDVLRFFAGWWTGERLQVWLEMAIWCKNSSIDSIAIHCSRLSTQIYTVTCPSPRSTRPQVSDQSLRESLALHRWASPAVSGCFESAAFCPLCPEILFSGLLRPREYSLPIYNVYVWHNAHNVTYSYNL